MPFLIFVVVGFVWFVLLLTDPAYTQYSQLNRARREFFQFYVLRVCMYVHSLSTLFHPRASLYFIYIIYLFRNMRYMAVAESINKTDMYSPCVAIWLDLISLLAFLRIYREVREARENERRASTSAFTDKQSQRESVRPPKAKAKAKSPNAKSTPKVSSLLAHKWESQRAT